VGDTCDVPEEELVDIGDFSLIDPGGDPSVLRAAADEWEARAGAIRGLSSRLGGRVSGLPRSAWDGDARDAFDGWWAQTADDLEQLATGFDEMAAQLRTVADGIEETNDVVHSIYIEIGATVAIGVAVSFISFGLGTAAAAARTAQLVARAMSWINKLKTLMRVVRASSAAFQTFKTTYLSGRIARFALRYGGLFLLLEVMSAFAQRMLGDIGFYGVTALGGLVSSASAVASAATLASQGRIPIDVAAAGAVIASLASAAVDLVIVARVARVRPLTLRLAVATVAVMALGVLGAFVGRGG